MAKAGLSQTNDPKSVPRIGRPAAIGAVYARAAAPALAKRGFGNASLLQNWTAIVGADLASLTAPLQIKFPRGSNDRGTLVLCAAHGSAATLVQMKTPVILERVNRYFGYPAVARVQMTQGRALQTARPPTARKAQLESEQRPLDPARMARITDSVANVGPADVKDALIRLGKSIGSRSP